jgi:hypothetical protein
MTSKEVLALVYLLRYQDAEHTLFQQLFTFTIFIQFTMKILSLAILFLVIVAAQAATLQVRNGTVSDSPCKLSKRVSALTDIAISKRLMGGLGAMSDMSGGSTSKASAAPATSAAPPPTSSTNSSVGASRMDNIRTIMGSGGVGEKLGAVVSLYKSIRGGSGSNEAASKDSSASSGGSGKDGVNNNSTASLEGVGSVGTSDNSTASSGGTGQILASGNSTTSSGSGSIGARKNSTAGSGGATSSLAAPNSQTRKDLSLTSNSLGNHMKRKRRLSFW